MKLDLQTVKEIALGAVRVTEEENGFNFYRFTPSQQELYKKRSRDFYEKTFAASGIKLAFKTNSSSLFMKVSVSSGSSRRYIAFEIFVNGQKIDLIDNFSNVDMPQNYTTISLPLGEFEKKIELGSGMKEVQIYFPWSARVTLNEIILDDNSFIEPIKPKNKLLCFGDSITQGYDALFPSNKYVSRLAHFLDAEEYNKAIGGEIFFPQLAREKDDFVPDYITVAYGTNDWGRCSEQEFTENCRDFFDGLKESYPDSRIFVITPIWRKDYKENRAFGDFENIEKIIAETVKGMPNVQVIRGFNFVEHNENFYADLRLHPNDEGFEQYFRGIAENIKV